MTDTRYGQSIDFYVSNPEAIPSVEQSTESLTYPRPSEMRYTDLHFEPLLGSNGNGCQRVVQLRTPIPMTAAVDVIRLARAAADLRAAEPLRQIVAAHMAGESAAHVRRLTDQREATREAAAAAKHAEDDAIAELKAAIAVGDSTASADKRLATARSERSRLAERVGIVEEALTAAKETADAELSTAVGEKLAELRAEANAKVADARQQLHDAIDSVMPTYYTAVHAWQAITDPQLIRDVLTIGGIDPESARVAAMTSDQREHYHHEQRQVAIRSRMARRNHDEHQTRLAMTSAGY